MSPAYYDGQQASGGGVTKMGNPYCPLTQAFSWSEWNKGWVAAESEKNKPAKVVRKFRPILWDAGKARIGWSETGKESTE